MSESSPVPKDTGAEQATEETVRVDIPVATKHSLRAWSIAWIVPVFALAFVTWMAIDYFSSRGPELQIAFDHAYGIHEHDRVTYKGSQIGTVESSHLNPESGQIEVTIRLLPRAEAFAREGAKAWIVRPELSLTKVSGLDTIVGASYVEMTPGFGDAITELRGLPDRPLLDSTTASGLKITLRRNRKGSADRGSPILYKGLHAGVVLSQSLRNDGGGIDVEIIVFPDFAHLLCEQSVFWDSGGIDMQVGLRGLGVQAESLESILTGSISFATPPAPQAGKAVYGGHSFSVHEEAQDAWLQWNPRIPRRTPEGVRTPETVSVTQVKKGRLLGGSTVQGSAVIVPDGYVMLASLASSEDLHEHSLGNQVFPTDIETSPIGDGVVFVPMDNSSEFSHRMSVADGKSDLYIAVTPDSPVLYVNQADLTEVRPGVLAIGGQLTLPESWHGAPVFSEFGELVGLLHRASERSAEVRLITTLPAK